MPNTKPSSEAGSKVVWAQPQGFGEKFDGRLLFHQRRHFIHLDLITWSQKAMKDPKHLADWCAALMALHRLVWGSFNNVMIKVGESKKKMKFNDYMGVKLKRVNKELLNSMSYYERGDGQIHTKVDRNKIKHLYLILDEIQKELADIEYQKNLDLPRRGDPVVNATTAGM